MVVDQTKNARKKLSMLFLCCCNDDGDDDTTHDTTHDAQQGLLVKPWLVHRQLTCSHAINMSPQLHMAR